MSKSKIKPLPYKEQINFAFIKAHKRNSSRQSITAMFGISQTILKTQLEGKPIIENRATSQHFLTLAKEQAIFNSINEVTQFKFPARLYMVKEKTALLIAL